LAITPPFQAPDEQVHFYRAYQVSGGGLIAEKRGGVSGGWLPESLPSVVEPFMGLRRHPRKRIKVDAILDRFSIPLDPSTRRFVAFETSAVYTPIPYLPQALGIGLGKALDLGPLTLLYLGRAANLVASLLLALLAVRLAPAFKWVFVLIALMPMAAFQMASVSADAFTNAIALLFTAMILRLALTGSNVDARALAALAAASLLLSLSKQAYAPLLLLFLAIPVSRLGGRRRYLAVFASLVALNAAALAGWAFVLEGVYAPPAWLNHVDPAAQLRWIAANPTQLPGILLERYSSPGPRLYLGLMVGRVLGWMDTPLPQPLISSYQFVLIAAALFDSSTEVRMGARIKILALAVVLVDLAVIGTMAYVGGSAVGAPRIRSLQGRYFIPLRPLLLLPLYNRTLRTLVLAWVPRQQWIARGCTAGLLAFLLLSSAITCFFVAARYYR
jgi:uncharacterized membrane protein